MLKVEANFIYQRKGLYEVILDKVADKERAKASDKGKDELAARVAAQSMTFSGGFAPQRILD